MTYPDIGGYDPKGNPSRWPCGSIFQNEGERLYRLVRDLKPRTVVSIGSFYGCGDTWLAAGLRDNGAGKLYSIDNCQQIGDKTRSGIPKDLFPWIVPINADALTFAWKSHQIDLLVEDGSHCTGFTKTILERFPADVVVCHDYCHATEGMHVVSGFREVLGEPDEIFLQPPSDCGLAIKWCKKAVTA